MKQRAVAPLGAALLMATLPAPVEAMTVAEFLAKAEVLKAKGMGALFAPELKQVIGEVRMVAGAYRAELSTAVPPQRASLGCPPPTGKVKIAPKDFIADLLAIPLAQRASTSMKTAYFAIMAKRFPCS